RPWSGRQTTVIEFGRYPAVFMDWQRSRLSSSDISDLAADDQPPWSHQTVEYRVGPSGPIAGRRSGCGHSPRLVSANRSGSSPQNSSYSNRRANFHRTELKSRRSPSETSKFVRGTKNLSLSDFQRRVESGFDTATHNCPSTRSGVRSTHRTVKPCSCAPMDSIYDTSNGRRPASRCL